MFKVWGAPGCWGAFFSAAILFLTLVGGAQATTADDVVKKTKELQDTIKAFDGKDDVPLNAALELSKALDKLNENSPVEERFTELLTKLTNVFSAWSTSSPRAS